MTIWVTKNLNIHIHEKINRTKNIVCLVGFLLTSGWFQIFDFIKTYRTTSLEDIYRHVTGHTLLPTSPTPVHSVPRDRPKGFEPRKDFSSFINYEDEYDEGEVTGYAVSSAMSPLVF